LSLGAVSLDSNPLIIDKEVLTFERRHHFETQVPYILQVSPFLLARFQGVLVAFVHIRSKSGIGSLSEHEKPVLLAQCIRSWKLEISNIGPDVLEAVFLEIIRRSTHIE
jgi:hypothetical protein